ncbi:MAG: hypothetical protein K6G55_07780 [Selenomonadaceae bacterium]|nr:hypothetical protein [Selenomonadaceae bacterium]
MKNLLAIIFAITLLFVTGCGDDDVDSKSAENKAVSSESKIEDIDWDNVPHFNNQLDLVNHIRQTRKTLETTLPVVLTDGFNPDINDISFYSSAWYIEYTTSRKNNSSKMNVLYKVRNYPGERVAYAYLHNDTSFLTDDEQQLYDVAVEIVDEANDFAANHSSPALYKQLYIHDAIIERTSYYTENPQPSSARFQTAFGALIDGKANCQGYTDAFYMLGTMCGLDVDKINGYTNKESHVWNTITFGDGKYYFVDLTWDDASFTFADTGEYNGYIYFNAPTDVAAATHKWSKKYAPNMVKTPDGRYFYYTTEFTSTGGKYFGAHSTTAQNALDYIARRICSDGYQLSWVVAPYDERYKNASNAVHYLTDSVLPNRYGWSGNVKMNVTCRGKYMFFTTDATPSR